MSGFIVSINSDDMTVPINFNASEAPSFFYPYIYRMDRGAFMYDENKQNSDKTKTVFPAFNFEKYR